MKITGIKRLKDNEMILPITKEKWRYYTGIYENRDAGCLNNFYISEKLD